MFNKIKAKASAAKAQVQEFINNKDAMSQTTEIVLMLVLVVVVIGAFFAPEISTWVEETVNSFTSKANDIFSIAP